MSDSITSGTTFTLSTEDGEILGVYNSVENAGAAAQEHGTDDELYGTDVTIRRWEQTTDEYLPNVIIIKVIGEEEGDEFTWATYHVNEFTVNGVAKSPYAD